MLIGSIMEKLEGEDGGYGDIYPYANDTHLENLIPEIKENKVDYLQEFVKLQSEYLKMLMKEKKETDNWKE